MASIYEKLLYVLAALYLAFFAVFLWQSAIGISGLQLANGNPVGGDFINLYTAGKLVLAGQIGDIYQPEAFQTAQRNLIAEDIGFRLWAYPPHSLFVAAPFALLPYYFSLGLWSLIGLGLLFAGIRAHGFSTSCALMFAVNPAALLCVYFGQTGNLATGLLLLALVPLRQPVTAQGSQERNAPLAGAAASILTIKPQFGLLLPIALLFQRKWRTFAVAVAGTLGLTLVSVLLFSPNAWLDYATISAPALTQLELNGSGAFMFMIPSFFMSFRLLGVEGTQALTLHMLIAVPIFAFTMFWMFRHRGRPDLVPLILIATALVTPYLHVYDMSLVVAAAMILGMTETKDPLNAQSFLLVLMATYLPHVLHDLNANSVPVAPLALLLVFGASIKKAGSTTRL